MFGRGLVRPQVLGTYIRITMVMKTTVSPSLLESARWKIPLVKGRPDGCSPNVRVPMVFIVFHLGILGDYHPYNTHVIPGLSNRDFPCQLMELFGCKHWKGVMGETFFVGWWALRLKLLLTLLKMTIPPKKWGDFASKSWSHVSSQGCTCIHLPTSWVIGLPATRGGSLVAQDEWRSTSLDARGPELTSSWKFHGPRSCDWLADDHSTDVLVWFHVMPNWFTIWYIIYTLMHICITIIIMITIYVYIYTCLYVTCHSKGWSWVERNPMLNDQSTSATDGLLY